MDEIRLAKKLLESKGYKVSKLTESIDTSIFNIKDNSDEAWDLYDDINNKVLKAVRSVSDDIDVDDSGLDERGSTEGDRTIRYRANTVARFSEKDHAYVPISDKEMGKIMSSLEKEIQLPKSDDKYDYSVNISSSSMGIEITLQREESI